MQCLEISGAVQPLYGSLGVKGLSNVTALIQSDAVSLQVCIVQSPIAI